MNDDRRLKCAKDDKSCTRYILYREKRRIKNLFSNNMRKYTVTICVGTLDAHRAYKTRDFRTSVRRNAIRKIRNNNLCVEFLRQSSRDILRTDLIALLK